MSVERLVRWLGLYRRTADVRAVAALLLANAIPLVGVLLLGWSLWTILAVYWLENGIVGLFSLAKILLARGEVAPGLEPVAAARVASVPPIVHRVLFAAFFPLHYGVFWAGHGVFVLGFLPIFARLEGGFGTDTAALAGSGIDWTAAAIGAGALFASHGVSFLVNYLWRGEYRTASPSIQAQAPYERVIALHVTILLGAWAIILIGSPVGALLVLVAVKAYIDLRAHLRERDRSSRIPVPTA